MTLQCSPTAEEARLHARVLAASAEGHGGGVELAYNKAARIIQRMARAFILRKRNREGRFIASARRGWIDAHPPPPFPADEALLRPEELLLLLRVLGAVPRIADEADVLDAALRLTTSLAGAGQRRRLVRGTCAAWPTGTGLTWESFRAFLSWLAGCLPDAEDGTSREEAEGSADALRMERLFRLLFEASGRVVIDRGNTRDWIRTITLEYLEMSRRNPCRGQFGQEGERVELRVLDTSSQNHVPEPGSVTGRGDAFGGGLMAASGAGGGSVCSQYLSACAKFEVLPVAGLAKMLLAETVNLAHHAFSADDVFALAHCLSGLSHVRVLDLRDCHLQPAAVTALCNSLRFGHSLLTLDLSENTLDKAGVTALATLLAATEALSRLVLSGVRLTDELFERLTTGGMERNKSVAHLDLAYNLLSDVSTDALEGMLLGKRALRFIDLSFNLLTDRGVERLHRAAVERSAPRSINRARGGRTGQQLPQVSLVADRRAQRHALANLLGLNPCFRYEAPARIPFTRTDLLSFEVILKDRRLSDGERLRAAALCTAGRTLAPETIVRLLLGCFKQCDAAHRSAAFQLLGEAAESQHSLEVIRQGIQPTFSLEVQEQDQLD